MSEKTSTVEDTARDATQGNHAVGNCTLRSPAAQNSRAQINLVPIATAPRAPTSPAAQSSPGTPTTSRTGSPGTARPARTVSQAGRWNRAATGWSPPGPARGPTGPSSSAGCWGSRTPFPSASPAPPTMRGPGPLTWTPGGKDPVLGIERMQEAYFRRFPDYPRGITVPAIVDVASGAVVTNNFPQITLDFSTEWTRLPPPGCAGPVPGAPARRRSTRVNKRVFTEVNNGVYRCGFAGSQEAYNAAYDRLWTAMDWLEERLAGQRYLVGDTITEADVRLFTTLARFDAVYHGHFKCNRQQAQRDAGAVGLRPGPVPDARLRRHHRLRADQAALLHRARGHQPHAGSSRRARTCPAG